MARRIAAVLIVLSLAVPAVYAEQPGNIRESIANMKFDREASLRSTPASQQVSASHGTRRNGLVVASLATLGVFGGMFVASRVALPCHCDDPESVVARGGLIGGIAGGIAGVIITLR